jgi:hypothetical protein
MNFLGGGGVYVERSKLTCLVCSIKYNTASNGNGGGLRLNNATMILMDCEIYENNALNGGGVFAVASSLRMSS